MRSVLYAAVAVAVASSVAQAQFGDQCRYEAERAATVDAAGVRLLDLQAGAGSLKVVGKAGVTGVHVRGRACASSRDLLEDITLDARRSGTAAVIKANVREHSFHWSWGGNQYARLDVVVEVPMGMAADIEDGSGGMELSGLGDTEINDGSGSIQLNDMTGRLHIKDGSGEIEMRNVAGPVDIDDGSGSIDVRGVTSSVRIGDGSGSIQVDNVGGDLVVSHDGSGSIDYDNVRGRVEVPRHRRHH